MNELLQSPLCSAPSVHGSYAAGRLRQHARCWCIDAKAWRYVCDSVLIMTLLLQNTMRQEANRKWLLTCKRSRASCWSAGLFNYIACAYNTAALPSLSTTSLRSSEHTVTMLAQTRDGLCKHC